MNKQPKIHFQQKLSCFIFARTPSIRVISLSLTEVAKKEYFCSRKKKTFFIDTLVN